MGKLFPDSTRLGKAAPKIAPHDLSSTKNVAEQQTETLTATGGTRTLTYSGQTTSALAYNASASTIQTALEALSNVGVGDIVVSQTVASGVYTNVFTFAGDLANLDVALMTVGTGSLTGGTSSIAKTGTSMAQTIKRQKTAAVLKAKGFGRPASLVSNDIELLQRRTPKDIGEEGRIPGEA